MTRIFTGSLLCSIILASLSCQNQVKNQSTSTVDSTSLAGLNLKRGEIISCSPVDGELFGSVSFNATIPAELQKDFNMAIALLHSFEYDESEKMFARVIDKNPQTAMAYWGVAMANFHPLWAPPNKEELKKGTQAVNLARKIEDKTKRESDYIEAIGSFFDNADKLDHKSRVLQFEKAMEQVYLNHKEDDNDAAVFYALALNAAADPTDKSYTRQKKAIAILNELFEKNPSHPGLAHYIIHNSDYPALAEMALPAARKYASIAPASAHAQHMPSHIFTRLGLWDESISSNLVSTSSAKCYAEQAKLNGNWDEELHGMDYLVYAYLQKGDDELARQQLEYLKTIRQVSPLNFKVAYAFASIPARYYLERKKWNEAATLEAHVADFPWTNYPWQRSIIHFTRLMGSVNTGQLGNAHNELDSLKMLYSKLESQPEKAKEAAQVKVQVLTGDAWIHFKEGKNDKAIELMKKAADLEDGSEKHPVTPGEVIPARELLGEMLLQLNKPALALEAFELTLQSHANRFNALYGAGIAASRAGNETKSKEYFDRLIKISSSKSSERKELQTARRQLSS
jgi:tetratricopeptide (TPR) repeat protein